MAVPLIHHLIRSDVRTDVPWACAFVSDHYFGGKMCRKVEQNKGETPFCVTDDQLIVNLKADV
jgi:hypothetical protein